MKVISIVPLKEQIFVKIDKAAEQVTEQVIKLLDTLKQVALSTKEAMQYLRLNHRPTFLYTYLQPALQFGLIEMTQPDSPRSPNQKYRLTEKGKQFLNTQNIGNK